jgi:hypothetical protein
MWPRLGETLPGAKLCPFLSIDYVFVIVRLQRHLLDRGQAKMPHVKKYLQRSTVKKAR